MVVESDSVCATVDTESDWAPGDSCMPAVLRFTESGWLTGTRIAMEKLRDLTSRQLKELQQVAKKKGVWLEHRSKGKLVVATRTNWLVVDQELAAFLPEGPEDNPISVANPVTERCPNAHRGCIFIGTSIDSLNAHKRFCNHTQKTKNMRDMRATAPAKAGNVQQSTADRTKGPMKAGNKRGLKKLKHKETTSAEDERTKEPRAWRSKATSKQ